MLESFVAGRAAWRAARAARPPAGGGPGVLAALRSLAVAEIEAIGRRRRRAHQLVDVEDGARTVQAVAAVLGQLKSDFGTDPVNIGLALALLGDTENGLLTLTLPVGDAAAPSVRTTIMPEPTVRRTARRSAPRPGA